MAVYNCPFEYLLMVDFSTTLQETTYDYPPEIIQFSVSVLDVKNKRVREDISFNEYCKPSNEPILTDYCIRTTGVQQENVDNAHPFIQVYAQFVNWLKENNFEEQNFAIACDTRDTLWRIAQYQFLLLKTPFPAMFRQWVDVSYPFFRVHGEVQEVPENNLPRLARRYGMELVGDILDARSNTINLARYVQLVLEDGHRVDINTQLICEDHWRKTSMFFQKDIVWQKDRALFYKMQGRILPLYFKRVSFRFDLNRLGQCPVCRQGADICTGMVHKQYPEQLFRDLLQTTRQVSIYAQSVGLGD